MQPGFVTDFELLLNILDQLLLLQCEGHVELRDPQLTDGLVLLVLRVGGFYVDFVEFIESSVPLFVGEYPGWLHASLQALLEPVEMTNCYTRDRAMGGTITCRTDTSFLSEMLFYSLCRICTEIFRSILTGPIV